MPSLITSEAVENWMRQILEAEVYELNTQRGYGETGVDVLASRDNEELFIEGTGFKSSPPARANDFYEIILRAVSRLDSGATKCIIALPARFGTGLAARARHYGTAWRRIGSAFPELHIWLVDTDANSITKRHWNEWP